MPRKMSLTFELHTLIKKNCVYIFSIFFSQSEAQNYHEKPRITYSNFFIELFSIFIDNKLKKNKYFIIIDNKYSVYSMIPHYHIF